MSLNDLETKKFKLLTPENAIAKLVLRYKHKTIGVKFGKDKKLIGFPIIEEDWITFESKTHGRRSAKIIKKNAHTYVVKPAIFTEGNIYRTVRFEEAIKIRIKKNSIREYPINTRPIN